MNDDSKKWQQRAARALQGWRADLSKSERAGDLAVLARLAVPQDALLLSCFAELCNRACGAEAIDRYRLDVLARCAFLAGRLLQFEEDASLAAGMAKRQGGSRPLVSPVRAAAVFALEDNDAACAAVASLLVQMGGRASARLNPLETVRVMTDWERQRRDVALAYYRASTAQPHTTDSPEAA